MKLLTNENFPLKSNIVLEENGFDVLWIGRDFKGYHDHEVMELAIREKRMIITFDSDYGELVFKHGYHPQMGVIYFRWDSFLPEEPGEYLLHLLSGRMIFRQTLTVITKNEIRQRKY
ncbi:MAG: DUF5615 family PIN-like protein [Bacteroidota bacterium]